MKENLSKIRTHNYLNQIKGGLAYKIIGALASFISIPLMLSYIGKEQYGVWSTLLSIIYWVVFFDLGIGNGLRNKVAESIAKHDTISAKFYISSGYTLIGFISIVLWIIVFFSSSLVNWQQVFNTEIITENDLILTIKITVSFILLNFWVGLINSLLSAVQKTAIIGLGQLISNLLALTITFILKETTQGSIYYLASAYGFSLLASNVILSIWFFKNQPTLIPKPEFNKKTIRPLVSTGIKFFIIQIAVLIIFTTDKILITHYFGPTFVAEYEVLFKLFSIITIAHSLFLTPLWSAYTDAYHRNDLNWIRKILHKQIKIFGGVIAAVFIVILLSKPIISLWIGNNFETKITLTIALGCFTIVSSWNNIFAMIVNGIGLINIQLITAVIAMMVNIPLSFLYIKYFNYGTEGVVMATCTSLLLAAIALPIQVTKLLKKPI